jgi:flavin reductase ActVB
MSRPPDPAASARRRSTAAERQAILVRDSMREAMSRLTTGVVVITSWVDGRPWGTTVSSCCSLSMEPSLLLICLANKATTTRLVLEQGCFGVSILAGDQVTVALRGAIPGEPKFIDDLVAEDHEGMGSPVLIGALASVHCELYNALVVGDHTVVVGEVGEVVLGRGRTPLTYFHRTFRQLSGEPLPIPDVPQRPRA